MKTEASYTGAGGEQEGGWSRKGGGSGGGSVTGKVSSLCPALPTLGLCPMCFVFVAYFAPYSSTASEALLCPFYRAGN